jgi:predicted ATPase
MSDNAQATPREHRLPVPRSSFVGRADEMDALSALWSVGIHRTPLAIELAATRANTVDARRFREPLAKRLDLLSGGRRDAPGRHVSFRAALDTSWELLEEHERSALAQCAVFRGGFTVAAAVVDLDPALLATRSGQDC